jgi:glycosyltransferase involved in cell wall biosynthesis
MKWWIKRNATAGLAVSRLAASDLLGSSWENDSRWQILYCGVDLKPFCENIKASEVRAEFGISEDTFVVGHVGRFDFPKNHNFLVEIAYEIAKIEPNMCLLLIGVGSLRAEIEEKVNRMGLSEMVIFAGSRPDVPRLMKGVMNINKRIKDNLFSL